MWTQVDTASFHIWNSFGMGNDVLKDQREKRPQSNMTLGE